MENEQTLIKQMKNHSTTHEDNFDEVFNSSNTRVRQACGYSFCETSSTFASTSSPQSEKDDFSSKNESDYYENMEEAYSEHKIDLAYKYAKLYLKECHEKKKILSSEEEKKINLIKTEMKDVQFYEKKLNQPGWKLQTKKKNVTVSTKYEGQTVGVLVQAQLDVEIQRFLCVMNEADLMKKYMPFVKESRLERLVSRNSRVAYVLNDFPILDNRQAFFQGIGYDRMDINKTIFAFSRTLHNREDLQKTLGYEVKMTPGTVQLEYHYFVLEYRPTSPKTGTLKLALNVDLKLSIPMFIKATASQNFGLDFYKNVVKIAKKFEGSEWEKKAKENPDFFVFLQRRIKEQFD